MQTGYHTLHHIQMQQAVHLYKLNAYYSNDIYSEHSGHRLHIQAIYISDVQLTRKEWHLRLSQINIPYYQKSEENSLIY